MPSCSPMPATVVERSDSGDAFLSAPEPSKSLLRGKGNGFFSRAAEGDALVTVVFKWSTSGVVQKHLQHSKCEGE